MLAAAIVLALVAHLWSASELCARTVEVSSIDELRKAIDGAEPGDEIIVADGKYDCDRLIEIRAVGTAAKPIEISAKTVGGVEIRGSSGFKVSEPAKHVILRGFKFTHEAGTVSLDEGTSHCRVTRNVFALEVPRRAAYLVIAGDDHEIDHNTFRDKKTEGQMLWVYGPHNTATVAQRTWIHHNYFYNFENSRRNNSSALHIGNSARSLSPAHSLVEYNLFHHTRGENEGAICNKCCDNIYRFNTFSDGCTELSLRHGNRCQVYGNFFVRTRGGLRFFGDDHLIFCNYFEGNHVALQIGNGGANVPPADLKSHDRPDRVQFVFNTFVDNRVNVVMRQRRNGLGATHLVFAHNVLQDGPSVAELEGPLPGVSWTGNLAAARLDLGDAPTVGFVTTDTPLRRATDGKFRLSGYRGMKISRRNYPFMKWDIDGQECGEELVTGADQVSDGAVSNRILTPLDVGPDAEP
jgi:poly(beta-D-mannuronate) lyase